MARPVAHGGVFRQPQTWVLLAAFIYALAQLLLLDLDRFFEWDEAVYVAEVNRSIPATGFAAHRARGITLLIAPVTLLTDSIAVLRIYLIAVSTAALAGAFLIWCRVISWATPLAAGFFLVGWMPVFYGSEVSPNLYVAFVAVALLGMTVRFARSRARGDLLGVGALAALVALLRPSDAVVLGIAVTVVVVAIARGAVGPFVAALVSGLAVGTAPWVVESWVRMDGPLSRLQTASDSVEGGLTLNLVDFARLLDGPLMGPQSSDQLPAAGVGWMVGLVALAGIGVVIGTRDNRQVAGAVLFTAIVFSTPYVVATGVLAPRFLLPAFALLCVAAGSGGIAMISAAPVRAVAAVPLLVVLVGGAAWNLPIVVEIGDDQTAAREDARALGHFLSEEAGGRPCAFSSQYGYPQISASSGCRGGPWVSDDPVALAELEAVAADGRVVALLSLGDPPSGLDDGWDCRAVPVQPSVSWTACFRSG